MDTAEIIVIVVVHWRKREAIARYTVRRLQIWREVEVVRRLDEEPKHGCVAAVAEEVRIGHKVAPVLVDEGGTGKGGRCWWEAEDDLGERLLALQRGHRHRRRAAAGAAAGLQTIVVAHRVRFMNRQRKRNHRVLSWRLGLYRELVRFPTQVTEQNS